MRLGIMAQASAILATLCAVGGLGALAIHSSAPPADKAQEASSSPKAPEGADSTVATLIELSEEANSDCRDSFGEKMERGCALRRELYRQIENLGWCYGEGAEATYLAEWAPCRTDTDSVVDRAIEKMDEPPPPSPPTPPKDRTWYVVATRFPDCVRTKLAFGVDTPQEVVEEMNALGKRYSYLREDDFIVGIIEPLGSPIFFVRGKFECQIARAQVMAVPDP